MKKLLAMVLCFALLIPCAFADDNSSLLIEIIDDMNIDALLYVRGKIDERLEYLRAEWESNGDFTGIWETAYFVDEFGDYTQSPYIRNKELLYGKFSNSAANNAVLLVRLLITKEPAIMLFEYGTDKVKNYYSKKTMNYTVTIKTEDGEKTRFSASIQPGGDRLFFSSHESEKAFFEMMQTPQKLSFYIVNKEYTLETYSFEFETDGFYNIYDQIFGE